MQSYMQDLVKKLTLDEIAAQTSVSKSTLNRYLTMSNVQPRPENGKQIISVWLQEIYLNG